MLHRAKKISSNFQSGTAIIKAKFLNADFLHKVNENMNNFINVDEELIIPRWLFDERQTFPINLLFSNKKEHFSKTSFCEKFYRKLGKLSHYLKLKMTLYVLVVLYITELVIVDIVT